MRRALASFLVVLASLAGRDASATTQLNFMSCPAWTGGNEYDWNWVTAASHLFQTDPTISSDCKPVVVTDCSPLILDQTHFNCHGAGKCSSQPYMVQTSGSGQPVPGNIITTAANPDDGNRNYCAYWGDDPHHPKNRGDPDCRGGGCGMNPIGDPVNVATGNMIQKETDFAVIGDGGLEFTRFYNSFMPADEAGIGSGWDHTWSRRLQIMASAIKAIRADGKVLSFALSGGIATGDTDMPETLQASGSNWILTTRDNQIETYDSTGKLISLTSPLGKVTTLIYSDGSTSPPNGGYFSDGVTPMVFGLLIRVVDFAGRKLTFTYDVHGRIVQMSDPTGGAYHYSYDSLGGLPTVQYPDNSIRTYVYNESVNTSGANLTFALTGIVDENNNRFATFKYSTGRLALSAEHASGVEKYQFTYNGTSTSYTDPLGTTRSSPITKILNVMQLTGTTQTCTGCGGTSTQTYTFDANRNRSSYKDFNGNLTCYTFGSRNLETAHTEGLSGSGTCASRVTTSATRTITSEWHSVWRLPKRIAEPLKITTFNYHGESGVSCAPTGASTTLPCSKTVQATTDANGSQGFSATADGAARTWSYTYNAAGQILTIDGSRTDVTDVTSYSYYLSDDPQGNYKTGDLASITNALNQTTQFTQYDGAGRLKKMIDPNGLETILAYNSRGWLASRQVGTATAGYEITTFDHDFVGQVTKVTLPDGSFVQYTFDAAHRLTDVQDGLGNRIHYTLDNAGNRTAEDFYDPSNTIVRNHSRTFDALNRLAKDIGGTNPAMQITQNAYDANGNLTSITDPLSRITTQFFDARNRLTQVRDPFNGAAAPTLYQYSGLDQLTQVTDPSALNTTYTVNGHGETVTQASPDTGTTTFTFDAASNLRTKLDARGIQASYSYDALNRLTQIVYPDETVIYTWDSCTNGIGRLCSISDNSGSTSYSFDVKGRVTSKTQIVAGQSFTMGYAFNSAGQLSTLTTPSGKQVVYTYSNNRPVSITVDGTKVLDTVLYEPFGPNGGWHWGNSMQLNPNTHTRTFDKDYRTTRVTSDLPTSGSQPYFDRQIGWDIESRVQSVTDLANSALNASYGYDSLDRLTSTTQGTSIWGYSYNGTGDRLTSTVNGATTNYGYLSGSHKLASLSGAQVKNYTVDAAGNMTSDGTTTWTYGGNNRPTQAGSTTFLINALGQRVKKTAGSTIIHLVFDEGGRLWGEYDGTGALIQETIWLDDLPVATISSAMSYVHPDHIGTPRMVTRSTDNAIQWRWDNTEAFGNSAPNQDPSGLGAFGYNLRFPGQYFDQETGTHYNYNRDFDPKIGRYIQSDPLGLDGGLNTYGYADNSPVSKFDPEGLQTQLCLLDDCPPPEMKKYQKCVADCFDKQVKKTQLCNGLPPKLRQRCKAGAATGRIICYIECTVKHPGCWKKTLD